MAPDLGFTILIVSKFSIGSQEFRVQDFWPWFRV